ncbi:prepilin-type N-terminal cleavage/methylation domain-containing protein [Microcoleus sp. BR0-C5]|uniref:prepilin-type N-terminal cleavage/methylation domain-containing protein n=1 Tax=Microcoleus sp. BR0-C5 TaxID=2818713 RepID=UPI002FD34AD6
MKTPPILLKLLHNAAAKPSPNFHKTASRKGDGGFTLLEVLVIALIIGIFSSIAAPSWQGFINRQRVRTVNDRVLQTLRTAQSEAKRTKSDVTVKFNYDPNANPPVKPTYTINTNTPQNLDAGGEIKPGQVKLFAQANGVSTIKSITFNYQGWITSPSIQSRTPRQLTDGFTVTIYPPDSLPNTAGKQCVIVETLIGGMRTGEGNDCPPPS